MDRAFVAAAAAVTLAKDDAREQSYAELECLYHPQAIAHYDVTNLGFMTSAELLASQLQLPPAGHLTSYLDLGTGTGLTALACASRMIEAGALVDMVLVNGLSVMVEVAGRKVLERFVSGLRMEKVRLLRGDVVDGITKRDSRLNNKNLHT